MIVGRIISDVISHIVPRRIEWLFAFMTFGMGFKLLQPERTFDAAPQSYRLLSQWATEGTWGWILFTVGASRLVALTLNGSWKPFAPYSPFTRAFTAFLSSGIMFALAIGIYTSNAAGLIYIPFVFCAIFDVILSLELAIEAGHALRRPYGTRRRTA